MSEDNRKSRQRLADADDLKFKLLINNLITFNSNAKSHKKQGWRKYHGNQMGLSTRVFNFNYENQRNDV